MTTLLHSKSNTGNRKGVAIFNKVGNFRILENILRNVQNTKLNLRRSIRKVILTYFFKCYRTVGVKYWLLFQLVWKDFFPYLDLWFWHEKFFLSNLKIRTHHWRFRVVQEKWWYKIKLVLYIIDMMTGMHKCFHIRHFTLYCNFWCF